jgi:hypothetical protein
MARLPYAGGRNGMGTTAVENDFSDQVEEAHGAGDDDLADGMAGKGPIQALPAMIAANERKMIRDSQAMPPKETVRDEIAMSMANTGIGSMPRNYMPPIGMAGNPQMQPPMQQMAEGGRVMRGYQQGSAGNALTSFDPSLLSEEERRLLQAQSEMGIIDAISAFNDPLADPNSPLFVGTAENIGDLAYEETGSPVAAALSEGFYELRPTATDVAMGAAIGTGIGAIPGTVGLVANKARKLPAVYKGIKRGFGRARSAATPQRFGGGGVADVLPESVRRKMRDGPLDSFSRRQPNTRRKGFRDPETGSLRTADEAYEALGKPVVLPFLGAAGGAGAALESGFSEVPKPPYQPVPPENGANISTAGPSDVGLSASQIANMDERFKQQRRIGEQEKRIKELESSRLEIGGGSELPGSPAQTAAPSVVQTASPSVAPGMSPYEEYLQNLYSMDNAYAQKLEDAKRRGNAQVMLQIASNMFKRGTSPFEGTAQVAQQTNARQAALERDREATRIRSALAEQMGLRDLVKSKAGNFLRAEELKSQDDYRRESLRLQEMGIPVKLAGTIAQGQYYNALTAGRDKDRVANMYAKIVDTLIKNMDVNLDDSESMARISNMANQLMLEELSMAEGGDGGSSRPQRDDIVTPTAGR